MSDRARQIIAAIDQECMPPLKKKQLAVIDRHVSPLVEEIERLKAELADAESMAKDKDTLT